ncbi:glycosyltransferase [bacterium]|nr:glycosyltransferase [bacterium]
MITIIIPTRNRAYTLKKVGESYYQQKHVNEIIFVDDSGDDNTKEVIDDISKNYPKIITKYIRHEKRKGASAGRITGYTNASNDYILFGEDDAYLEKNYTDLLLNKIVLDNTIGLVSGRIIYKLFNERNEESEKRFGFGIEKKEAFDKYHFGNNINAYFESDIELPMTHALFLTKKSLLEKFGYDPFYSKGNGYREESDFQINAFVNGYKIVCTNDTHCYHMSRQEVQKGGQRVNRFKQLYWNIYFTNYFYNKYFNKLKDKLNITYSKNTAIVFFSFSMFTILFINPIKKIPQFIWRRIFK